MKRKTLIGGVAVLVALAVTAGVFLGLRPHDTVSGCAKAIRSEWALNMADPSREVKDDVDYIPQCDGLTPHQQDQAGAEVASEILGNR
jgi:hypothetical protein